MFEPSSAWPRGVPAVARAGKGQYRITISGIAGICNENGYHQVLHDLRMRVRFNDEALNTYGRFLKNDWRAICPKYLQAFEIAKIVSCAISPKAKSDLRPRFR